jgi:hypothetical protein
MPKPYTYTRYVLCYISDMPTRAYFFLFFCLLLPFLPTQCDKDKLTIITPPAPFHGPLPLVLSLPRRTLAVGSAREIVRANGLSDVITVIKGK